MKRSDSVTARLAGFKPAHFLWEVSGGVATVTLNRPEKKNPPTFESYAELRDIRALRFDEGATEVQKLVIARQLLSTAR